MRHSSFLLSRPVMFSLSEGEEEEEEEEIKEREERAPFFQKRLLLALQSNCGRERKIYHVGEDQPSNAEIDLAQK